MGQSEKDLHEDDINIPPKADTKAGSEADTDDIPLKTLLLRIGRVFFFIVLWVFPSYLAGRYVLHVWNDLNDAGNMPRIWFWKPFIILQVINTALTYAISRLLGMPVTWHAWETVLYYPDALGAIEIIPDCTGILEMIFIAALMMGFSMGFNLRLTWRQRFKWIGVLCGIIFVENIIRLVLNWPIADTYGKDVWENVHIFWWKQGQLFFVILLFLGWFILVGRKYTPYYRDNGPESEPNINLGNDGKIKVSSKYVQKNRKGQNINKARKAYGVVSSKRVSKLKK